MSGGFTKYDIKIALKKQELECWIKKQEMEESGVKQVIVMRKDLRNVKGEKIRTGKLIAQGSHASLGVVLNSMREIPKGFLFLIVRFIMWILKISGYKSLFFAYKKSTPWDRWLNGRFTKVCVYCKDDNELQEIYLKAQEAGIPSVLITDAGLTEFGGVPTNTCVGIGPFWASEIDKITGNLPLL